MGNRLMLLFLAVALCAGASARAAGGEAALAGPVSYEVRSWGRLLLRWQINPDGTGEIWHGPRQRSGTELRKYRLRLEGEPLRQLAANLEEVRLATSTGLACEKQIFDLPYGSVTWDYPQGKQVYSFDAGCSSDESDKAMDLLGAASTIVETMASVDGEPYMIEPVTPR